MIFTQCVSTLYFALPARRWINSRTELLPLWGGRERAGEGDTPATFPTPHLLPFVSLITYLSQTLRAPLAFHFHTKDIHRTHITLHGTGLRALLTTELMEVVRLRKYDYLCFLGNCFKPVVCKWARNQTRSHISTLLTLTLLLLMFPLFDLLPLCAQISKTKY